MYEKYVSLFHLADYTNGHPGGTRAGVKEIRDAIETI